MPYEFKVQHIPVDGDNRPGITAEKWSFTIHNTGNTATDENEAKNLSRTDNDEEIGFNYVCDNDSVIETIPDSEIAYHCGNKIGNYHSVSLEICEIAGAEDIAIEFTADYFYRHGWEIDRLTTHNFWNGKYCPRLILPHWDKFVGKVQKRLEELKGAGYMLKKLIIFNSFEDIGAARMIELQENCPMISRASYDITKPKAEKYIIIGGTWTPDDGESILLSGKDAKGTFKAVADSL